MKELNDRFADWYFIISDDVYKKIHLGRDDIVKKKEAEKDAKDGSASALDELEGPARRDLQARVSTSRDGSAARRARTARGLLSLANFASPARARTRA